MTTTPFEHSPLDSAEPRAVNFLELLPCPTLKGPIRCELHQNSLDEDVRYEVVSYTWGEPELGYTVFVNHSYTLDVTPNCLEALMSLRRRFHRRRLWIDAICIDQRENDRSKRERDRQVKIMGDIYHKAQKVLIWLGPAEPSTARTITKVKLLARLEALRRSEKFGLSALFALEKYLSNRMFEGEIVVFVPRKRYQALKPMICSPWWQRVWTLQEQVLARQCEIYHDRQSVSVSSFQAYQQMAFHVVEYLTLGDNYYNHEARNYIHNFCRLCDFQDGPMNRVSSQLHLKKDFIAKSLLDMAFLLEAKRPVDKIYGLYSILTAYCDLPLPDPDYNKTAEDVYEETIWTWINTRADLSILKLAARPSLVHNLPSWVPAWHQQHPRFMRNIRENYTPEQLGFLRNNSHFNWHRDRYPVLSELLLEKSRNTEEIVPVAARLSLGKLCVLRARFMGKLSHAIGTDRSHEFGWYLGSSEGLYMHLDWCRLVRDVVFHSTTENEEALHEVFRSLRFPGIYEFESSDVENRNEIFESFQAWFNFISYLNDASQFPTSTRTARTDADHVRELGVNLYYDICDADEEATNVLENRYSGDVQGREGLAKLARHVQSIHMTLSTMRNHSLCILDNDNMIAITDYWCQEGDEVFVFPGTDSPFVLRKAPDGRGYRLIGPALVDRLFRVGYQKWRSEGDDLQDIMLI